MEFSESLYVKEEGHFASIEFGSRKANAMTSSLLERLSGAIIDLSSKRDIKTILLKSEGKETFCAGASFDEFESITTQEEGKAFFMKFAKVFLAIRNTSKLVLARCQGKAVGGGVGILAACDYVWATEASAIKLSELKLGIGPFVISPVLKRKMGVASLTELTLTPERWKNAYWAQNRGLYAKVFETTKEMDQDILYTLDNWKSYNQNALQEIKKMFWNDTQNWNVIFEELADVSARLIMQQKNT